MRSPTPLPLFAAFRPMDRRGFTLVELLVVIVIILILAAIIFPVVSTMTRQGNQTTSAANLRQWYTGFSASLGDNDGSMPGDGESGGYTRGDQTAWYNRMPMELKITPYSGFGGTPPRLRQRSIWINPQVPPAAATNGAFIFCYGYNTYLSNTTQPTQKFARVEHPDRTVLMGEKADPKSDLKLTDIRSYFGSGSATDPLVDSNNSANFLFCDGHVQNLKRSVFAPAQNPTMMTSASMYTDVFTNNSPTQTLPLTMLPYVDATP